MSTRNFKHKRGQNGLSLIELMIAMVIGLILLLGLVQVMSASRNAYQLSTGVARTQENARFAVDYIQRDLRMAGHMGCVNDQAHMAPERPSASDATRQGLNLWFLTPAQRTARNFQAASFPLRFDMGVQGFEATGTAPGGTRALTAGTPVVGNVNQWSPALPNDINTLQPIAGSDILVVRYLSRDGVPATLAAASATSYTITPESYGSTVSTTDSSGLFGLADCQQASVFAANGGVNAAGVVSASVTGLNGSGLIGDEWSFEGNTHNKPVLYRAEAVVYYVGVGEGTNVDNTKPPSLFRARAIVGAGGNVSFVKEELVEGVESLQLLYGMDEHLPNDLPRGNVERTRVASAVNTAPTNNPNNTQSDEWRRIGSVQVGLLMRSSDRSGAEQAATVPNVLGLNLTRPATNDGHYRSAYETTVVLRNRLFGN